MAVSRKRPLTDRELRQLATTASVGGVPGLECVVSPGGTKAWRLLYRLSGDASGRRRSIGLGRYPGVSLGEARERAAEALKLAAVGQDPKHARSTAVQEGDRLLGDVASAYLDWCETINSAATVADKRSLFRSRILPALGSRPVAAVARRDVTALLDALSHSPARRRAAYAYMRHFMGWAQERQLIDANPLDGIRAPKTVAPRDRVLSDEEIRDLWSATGTFAAIARLSMLTAQRRGAVEKMRWADIDESRRVWVVPASAMKSGKLHEVPLSQRALDELAELPRGGAFVFGVGSGGDRPYNGSSNGMDGLRRQLHGADWRMTDFSPWRLHDARRTAVTLAQRGGAMIEEIRALTQHKTPGVIGVYARHAYADEKRKVVEIIAGQIAGAISMGEREGK